MQLEQRRLQGWERFQHGSLIVGVAALALCLLGAFFSRQQFFQAYLLAYIFWLGIALGCLGIVMLHNLSGGGWGVVGHIGRQKVKGFSDASYTDYKLGVTKDIGGFVFGAAYVDTNAKGSAWTYADARKSMNIGDSGVVLSVSKTF